MKRVLLSVLLFANVACTHARAVNAARHTIAAAATVTDIIDRTNASMLRQVCEHAEAPRACIDEHKFSEVAYAITVSDTVLRQAEATLDGLTKENTPRIRNILACVAQATHNLSVLAVALRLPLPDEATQALSLVVRFMGTCGGTP